MGINRSIFWLALFFLWITTVPVMAGGLYLHEFGTPSTGTAGAGSLAWAHDASTALYNAASMTRIEGDQLMVGAMALYSTVEFNPDADTPNSGGGGGDAGGFLPAGGAYFVHSFSNDLKLGISLTSLSGAALDYDNNWTGRYQNESVDLFTVYLTSSIGYRVNDWLSVGAGVSLIYAELDMDLSVNLPANIQDGKVKLDGDDTGTSFKLSALFELSEKTRLGIGYLYKTDLDFSGDLKFKRLGREFSSNTKFTLPQTVKVSIYHEINPKIALLGTVGWEEWSDLDKVTLSLDNGSGGLPRNWDDTWHFAGGIHYRLSDPWLLQCGIAYATSPVSSDDRTADMPVDRQIRYAAGALFDWSETLTIGSQLEYIDLGNSKIKSGNLIGEYDKNNMMVASITFNWKW